MIPGTNELHTRAEPTWRRLGPQFLNSLKSVGSLLVPFHLSPILFSVENMDTLHWSFPYAQKEASSLPLTSSGVHTPRQRNYKISKATEATFILGYSKKKIHQKALAGSAQVPLLKLQWLNGHVPRSKQGSSTKIPHGSAPPAGELRAWAPQGIQVFQTIISFLLAIKLQRNLLSVNSQNVHIAVGFAAVCQNILLRFSSRWKHAFQETVLSRGKCFLHRSA